MTTAHEICKHCGKEAVHLAMGGVYQVVGDEDDDLDGRSIYADREIEVEISIGTHTCFECGEIEDIWIEYPREVSRLQARVEELEAALRPFEPLHGHLYPAWDERELLQVGRHIITYAHLRMAAAAALDGAGKEAAR